MTIYTVSAFTADIKNTQYTQTGNKAGVCLNGAALNSQQKQAIAKQMGYSETVFISKPTNIKSNTLKLEYFTPVEEVELCGHATIAAFTLLREKNLLTSSTYTIQTLSGDHQIMISSDTVFMNQNRPEFTETLSRTELEKAFDIQVAHEVMPIEIGSTGLRDIILPVKDFHTLEKMKPNFREIINLSTVYNVAGIHAFAMKETDIKAKDTTNSPIIHCRNFAPIFAINEESATGTANCVLASYLWKNKIIRDTDFTFRQGESMDCPSEIIVKLKVDSSQITNVSVGGRGIIESDVQINI